MQGLRQPRFSIEFARGRRVAPTPLRACIYKNTAQVHLMRMHAAVPPPPRSVSLVMLLFRLRRLLIDLDGVPSRFHLPPPLLKSSFLAPPIRHPAAI